jgi:hypothetical protein
MEQAASVWYQQASSAGSIPQTVVQNMRVDESNDLRLAASR